MVDSYILIKSMLANPLYEIVYSGIIKYYDHDEKCWLFQFDNGDDDALIQYYDSLLKYVNKDALNFPDYQRTTFISQSNRSS